jgi:hypothetical protein
MNVIICIDDNNGMMFNHRRQSQDRTLRERIISTVKGKKLLMNEYSFKQFQDCDSGNIAVDEDFLSKACEGDYCFVENVDINDFNSNIEELIIYKWNRSYPSDMKLNSSFDGWKLQSSVDFKGYSHDKITEEVWTK